MSDGGFEGLVDEGTEVLQAAIQHFWEWMSLATLHSTGVRYKTIALHFAGEKKTTVGRVVVIAQ